MVPRASYAKIILATVLFSLSPLFVKLIDLDALSILWTLNLVAVVTLFARILLQGRSSHLLGFGKTGAGILLVLGLSFTINNALFNSAIKITTIANSVLTHYLAPVLVAVLGLFLLRERVTRTSILALILSLLGLGLMFAGNEFAFTNAHFLGLVLGALSAVFFALEIVLKRMLAKRFGDADIIVACYLLVSVVLLTPFASFGSILSLDAFGIASLLGLGVVVVGFGVSLFTSGLRDVSAQHAAIISYLEPLGAIILGFVVIAEVPTLNALLGGALILAGTALVIVRGQNSHLRLHSHPRS